MSVAEILLVEDSPADARLVEIALDRAKVGNVLHVVTDGDFALAYLRNEPPFADAARPDLVLLDINLPKRDGFEVLRDIRESPRLRSLPVVVLTSSRADSDALRSRQLEATAFVNKPTDLAMWPQIIRQLERCWLASSS